MREEKVFTCVEGGVGWGGGSRFVVCKVKFFFSDEVEVEVEKKTVSSLPSLFSLCRGRNTSIETRSLSLSRARAF